MREKKGRRGSGEVEGEKLRAAAGGEEEGERRNGGEGEGGEDDMT